MNKKAIYIVLFVYTVQRAMRSGALVSKYVGGSA